MWWAPGPPRGKGNAVARQAPHHACVWARRRASGLPLHAISPLHLTPLHLGCLPSPGGRAPRDSSGRRCSGLGGHYGWKTDPKCRGRGGRITYALSLSAPRLPDGSFLEPAALTLAWASGWTLSVAMAGAGGGPSAARGARTGLGEGKAKAARAAGRPS